MDTGNAGWITYREALERDPGFFRRRRKFAWLFNRVSRLWHSRFGFAEQRVQLNKDGSLGFDRVIIGEAPAINAIAYGIDELGRYLIAVIMQERPFADNPWTLKPATPPILFAQPVVMGFLEKVLGKRLVQALESAVEGAIREAMQEAGVRGILDVKPMGKQNATPTYTATWLDLFEIKVDLKTVTSQVDSEELIHQAVYLPVGEVLHKLDQNDGWNDEACYRAGSPNGVLALWLARHPDAMRQAADYLEEMEKLAA